MTIVAYILAWYLAVGFLIGAICLNVDGSEWDGNIKAMFRYMAGMLVVSCLFWLPFTIIYLQAKWRDRKARRSAGYTSPGPDG